MLSYILVFYFLLSLKQFYPILIVQLINNQVLVRNLRSNNSKNLTQLISAETQILFIIGYIIRYAAAVSYLGLQQEEIFSQILIIAQIFSWIFLFLRMISKKYNQHISKTQLKKEQKPAFLNFMVNNVSFKQIMYIVIIGIFLSILGNYFKMLNASSLLDYQVVLIDIGSIITRLAIIPQYILLICQSKNIQTYKGRQIFVILRWLIFFGISKGFYIADQSGELQFMKIMFLSLIFKVILLFIIQFYVIYVYCSKKENKGVYIDFNEIQGSIMQFNPLEKQEDQKIQLYTKI